MSWINQLGPESQTNLPCTDPLTAFDLPLNRPEASSGRRRAARGRLMLCKRPRARYRFTVWVDKVRSVDREEPGWIFSEGGGVEVPVLLSGYSLFTFSTANTAKQGRQHNITARLSGPLSPAVCRSVY